MTVKQSADTPKAANTLFQERVWIVQRIAWGLLVLFLIAALAGLTGQSGAFAHRQTAAGPAVVTYPAISRWQMADELQVEFDTAADRAELILPQAFLDVFVIESIAPQPASAEAIAGGQRYVFDIGPGQGPKTVHFAIRASQPKLMIRPKIRADGNPAALSILVLP
jgi:hypothetical protein